MEEHQEEQELYRLKNLDVEAIGLVRKGANRSPFYVVKSASGGVETMTDQNEDLTAESTDEGQAEVVDRAAFEGLQAQVAELKAQLAAQPEAEPEPEPVAEASSEEETDEYAEKLAEAEERFAEQLAEERKLREEVAEKFAESERLRRLAEFTEGVKADFASLPIGEAEQFAEDMMAIHDADAERHGRLVKVLKAAQEAVEQGALFEQFSSAQPTKDASPFDAKVEAVRTERYSAMPYEEGFYKAWLDVEKENPDLARQKALEH